VISNFQIIIAIARRKALQSKGTTAKKLYYCNQRALLS